MTFYHFIVEFINSIDILNTNGFEAEDKMARPELLLFPWVGPIPWFRT